VLAAKAIDAVPQQPLLVGEIEVHRNAALV